MTNPWGHDRIAAEVNLPTREFLFTLDQIAQMLDVSMEYLQEKVLFFYGRSPGSMKRKLVAVNISLPHEKAEWRVSETEFMVWMRYRRIKFVEKRNIRVGKGKP